MNGDFLNLVLPIFVLTGIGFAWVRTGRPFDTSTISALAFGLAVPCLLLASLDRPGLTLALFVRSFMAGALALSAFAVVGTLGLRALGLPVRPYLPAIMLPNTGNLGLPLALYAFGDEGLVFAIAFSSLVQICHFTIGVALVSGRFAPRQLLVSPTLWSVAAAFLMLASGVKLPGALSIVTKEIGAIAPPLMLMMVGASLARLGRTGIATIAILSLLRVAGGFAVGLIIARLLNLPPAAGGAFVLQCAMPVAVLSHVLADRHGGPAEDIAGLILGSTALSFAALPLMLMVLHR